MQDWKFDEALAEAYRDVRPLMQRHRIKWFLDASGILAATCACGSQTYNWDAIATHLVNTVLAVRGPTRPPKPPKKA